MKTRIVHLIIGLLMISSLKGQIKIGDNPQTLDPSSVLELESTSRVLVITRVTDTQMNTITPLRGALVYNTDQQCVHYYNGTDWINICEALDNSFTVSTDAVFNQFSRDSTVVVTQVDDNYNFEVNLITGDNIVPTSINGDVHIQPSSITGGLLQDATITFDKLADGENTGEVLQWNGNEWILVDETGLVVTEVDGEIGNEVLDATIGGSLERSGAGTDVDPFTLDVSDGGISNTELAPDAVTTDKIQDGSVNTDDIANLAVTNVKLDKANIPLSGFGPAATNLDLGNNVISNVLDPVLPQDAATKNYVDTEITASTQTIVSTDAGNSITASGTDGGAFYDDSALQTAITTNTTNIGTNQTNIATNVTNIGTNTTDLANHITADLDIDNTNEIQDISTDGSAGDISINSGSNITLNVNDADFDPTNEIQDAAGVSFDDTTANLGETDVQGALEVLAAGSAADADPDPNNEIQDLDFTAGQITLSGDPTPTTIDLSAYDTNAADDFDGTWGSLTGIPAGFADDIDDVDDADNNATNEIQDLDFTAGQITLSGDPTPTTIDLSAYDTNAADDFDGTWGSLTGIPAGFADDIDDVDDADNNATNEIQDLDFTAGQITLSGDPTPTTIDLSAYDTNAADDFDGAWSSLTGVPAGFADDTDDVDDADNNATNEIQDLDFTAGQITLSGDPTPTTIDLSAYDTNAADDFDGAWGSLTAVPAGFADNTDDNTTYTNGAGLSLVGTTFSVNNLAGEVTGPTNATVIANDAVTTAKVADNNVTPAKIEPSPTNGQVLTTIGGSTVWQSPYHAIGKANSSTLTNSNGVTSITPLGTGNYQVNFASNASSVNYVIQLTLLNAGANATIEVVTQANNNFTVQISDTIGTAIDAEWYFTVTDF
ncbi:hypothetical protein [Flagellimonas sp. S3867]|uniref:beta strand repeat-containing protein n=1 Tax=Flagellimonas sp. S3867 TaxID=2768063 RepID=UPI0016868870|nr:hypothetical protein [Flagellimonas sp. S3867]